MQKRLYGLFRSLQLPVLLALFLFIPVLSAPAAAETFIYEDFDTGGENFLADYGYFLSGGYLFFNGDGVEGSFSRIIWNQAYAVGSGDNGYYEDYAASVEVAWAGGDEYGSYGLFTSINENDSYDFDGVLFLINSYGTGSFLIAKIVDNSFEILTNWTNSSLIGIDKWNLLTVEKNGYDYRFLINGYEVDNQTIYDFYGGNLGMYSSNIVDAAYDNFIVETASGGGSSDGYYLSVQAVPESAGEVYVWPEKDYYDPDEWVSIEAYPASNCSEFIGWSGDCKGTDYYCDIQMNENKTVLANFSVKSFTLNVITDGGFVEVYPEKDSYDCGEMVYLYAVPDPGNDFNGWSGDVDGSYYDIEIEMDSDKTVIADFGGSTADGYRLVAQASPSNGGYIEIDPDKTAYDDGETVVLNAGAESCYTFTGWTGDCTGSDTECTLSMDKNMTAVAIFTPGSFPLTIEYEGGTVIKNPDKPVYKCGEKVKLTAVPDPGGYFIGWSGDETGTSETITIVMDYEKYIEAKFTTGAPTDGYVIKVTATNGTVTKTPDKSLYELGETVSILAKPNSGYAFSEWKGAIESTSNPLTIAVTGNMSLTAVFTGTGGTGGELAISPTVLNMLSKGTEILKATGGKSPFTWTATSGTLIPNIGENVNYTAPASTGAYTITLKDGNGDTATITANVYQELTLSPQVLRLSAGEDSEIYVKGGKSPYVATSSEIAVGNVVDGLLSFKAPKAAGQYQITFKDDMGQETAALVIVSGSGELAVTPETVSISPGEHVTLTATGGSGNYTWTAEAGKLLSTSGRSVIYLAPDVIGTYAVTVSDQGKKAEVTVTVSGELNLTPLIISVVLGDKNPIRFKTLGGVPAYEWWAESGDIKPSDETGTVALFTPPAETGRFEVKVTDGNGQIVTALVNVVSVLAVTPQKAVVTPGETRTFSVTGGQSPYTWNASQGDLSQTQGSSVAYTAPDQRGEYTITVRDNLGIESKITVIASLGVYISPASNVVAIGERVRFKASRGTPPYDWPDGSQGEEWSTTYDKTGRYEVTVSDSSGDTALAVVRVINDSLFLTPTVLHLKPGESAHFSVKGGSPEYIWSAEAGVLTATSGSVVGYIAPDESGIYRVTVADARGVEGIARVNVSGTTALPKTGIQGDGNRVSCEDTTTSSVAFGIEDGDMAFSLAFPEYESGVDIYVLLISPGGKYLFVDGNGNVREDDGTYPPAISNPQGSSNLVVRTDMDRCGTWGVYWLVTDSAPLSGLSGAGRILSAVAGNSTELNYYWCNVECR